MTISSASPEIATSLIREWFSSTFTMEIPSLFVVFFRFVISGGNAAGAMFIVRNISEVYATMRRTHIPSCGDRSVSLVGNPLLWMSLLNRIVSGLLAVHH